MTVKHGERKTEVLKVRLTARERKAIERAARERGCKVSAIVRQLLARGLQTGAQVGET